MNALGTTENATLTAQAREALRGRWGLAIGTYLVYNLILIAVGWIPFLGGFITLAIGGPMFVGLCIFSLSLSRRGEAQLSQIFAGFERFGVALGTYLLVSLVVGLAFLLLVIPGIYLGLCYWMAFYIIAESDSVGVLEAMSKSKALMEGHKWKLFCLNLRFFGWSLLCLLTLGIGYLVLAPYAAVSYANFYDDITSGVTASADMTDHGEVPAL